MAASDGPTVSRVRSGDGVELAVQTVGAADGPVVVAVHGYPDNRHVWDGVAELLAAQGLRVVTYDVRGAGESDKPRARGSYRQRQLTEDLLTVLDEAVGARPVHLLAHDWGSIQTWPSLTDPRFAGRVASFTSVSGPSLDHAGAWFRRVAKNPRAVLRQAAHSYYIALFQLPALPELAARRGLLARALDPAPYRTLADQTNGVQLYRANMGPTLAAPKPVAVEVPVQLIVPEHDAFVTPELAIGAAAPWVADLTVHRVDGGHWIVSADPQLVAGPVLEFVAAHAGDGPADRPKRPRTSRPSTRSSS